MTNYSDSILRLLTCDDFMSNHYQVTPKPFIFWDTCALLDAIRFLARHGELSTFRAISWLAENIQKGKIYSLASQLFIKEWNDHVLEAEDVLQNFLKETTMAHAAVLKVVNFLYSSNYSTVSLENHNLNDIFDNITKSIIQNTIFIKETEELKLKAYDRVVQKLPPATKKNEAKDCTIWETEILVAQKIKALGLGNKLNGVFFSSNIEDFVNRGQMQFYPILLKEAHDNDFSCSMNYDDSMRQIDGIKQLWGIK